MIGRGFILRLEQFTLLAARYFAMKKSGRSIAQTMSGPEQQAIGVADV